MIKIALEYNDNKIVEFPVSIIKFADGQTSSCIHLVDRIFKENKIKGIVVYCYIRSNDEFISLLQVFNVLDELNLSYNVVMPYLFGARSDRRFCADRSFDLEVYLNMIFKGSKSLSLKKGIFQVFDPHNIENKLYYNFGFVCKISAIPFINKVIDSYNKKICVVFPDKGAFERYKDVLKNKNVGEIIVAEKKRDEEGKIFSFKIDYSGNELQYKTVLVIDDICDGGSTLLCVADSLQRFSIENLDLYVSHGVFSRGIDMIADKYTTINCSNSYSDIYHPQVKQFDITKSFFSHICE